MSISLENQPQVTIVVVPRERFSCTQDSLESIYEHTKIPFDLVYVDGNSPTKVANYLQTQARVKNFQLVRTDCYLAPNKARNLGLSYVKTKYVVFIDNDVILTPNWLQPLVNCAEETGAAVVGPLMCQNKPLHEIVHFAGGESHIVTDVNGKQHIREKMYKQGQKVAEVRPQLKRMPTELTEFHCMLVRTKIFEQIGTFDEAMLNTKEHLDFCMLVTAAGETVYFEPDSIMTYVQGSLELSDIHYFMLRWSNAWTVNSLEHLRQKWDLETDGYFKSKYKKLGWRRREQIISPLSRRLSLGLNPKYLGKIFRLLDKNILNPYLTYRHARQQLNHRQKLAFAARQTPKTLERV
ncbi:glycosyltransferase family 2 protein [Myxosarcina sp. GI1]|uniref:glycosyltransferase family 2 protein n=1 Tax=Myxosarcina sp. GI1 TaxID=1541065 RepID=UPI0005695185|nr:glycosyltransferase [Myxosarcina sp. GI1]